MNYHVLLNLKHNGRAYKRGETVEVEEGTKAATILLADGVISETPIPEVVVPQNRERIVDSKDKIRKPKVGGARVETGEPSMDGPDDQGSSSEAEDVTPVVSDKMTRQELEDLARERGIEEAQIEAAPNKGALVDLITTPKPAEEPTEPEADPSANL